MWPSSESLWWCAHFMAFLCLNVWFHVHQSSDDVPASSLSPFPPLMSLCIKKACDCLQAIHKYVQALPESPVSRPSSHLTLLHTCHPDLTGRSDNGSCSSFVQVFAKFTLSLIFFFFWSWTEKVYKIDLQQHNYSRVYSCSQCVIILLSTWNPVSTHTFDLLSEGVTQELQIKYRSMHGQGKCFILRPLFGLWMEMRAEQVLRSIQRWDSLLFTFVECILSERFSAVKKKFNMTVSD
jgi:hypothetical protein